MRAYEYVHNHVHTTIRLENVTYIQWEGGSSINVIVHFVGITDTIALVANDANAARALFAELTKALNSRDDWEVSAPG